MSQMEDLLEDLYDGYAYKLVSFPHDQKLNDGDESDEEPQMLIEAVPSTWIEWNATSHTLQCYWMPGISTKKTQARFLALLRRAAPPNTTWPKFEVEIKGRAKTYEDVKKAVKDLKNKRYAYSTDDEIECQKKVLEEKKKYQRKTLSSNIPVTVDSLDNFTVDLTNTREKQKNIDFNHNDTQRDMERSSLRKSTSPISQTLTGLHDKKKKSRIRTKQKCNSPSNSQRSSSAELTETYMSDFGDRSSNNCSSLQLSKKSINAQAIVHERDPKEWKTTPSRKINSTLDSSSKKSNSEDKMKKSTSDNLRGFSQPVEVWSKTSGKRQERESPLRRQDSCGISTNCFQTTPVRHSFYRDSWREKNTPLINIESRSNRLSTLEEEKQTEKVEDSDKYLTVEHYNSLVKRIADLKGMVVTSIQIMKNVQATVQQNPRGTADNHFENEAEALEGIQLPCLTMDTFDEFNDMLQNNREFRNQIAQKIENSVNKNRPISRCLGDIMRAFVSNDVGHLLVPVKPTPNKKVFKDTKLCDLLRYVYTRAYGAPGNPLSNTEFTKALQGVLHNTKYWKVADRQADRHVDHHENGETE